MTPRARPPRLPLVAIALCLGAACERRTVPSTNPLFEAPPPNDVVTTNHPTKTVRPLASIVHDVETEHALRKALTDLKRKNPGAPVADWPNADRQELARVTGRLAARRAAMDPYIPFDRKPVTMDPVRFQRMLEERAALPQSLTEDQARAWSVRKAQILGADAP